jgi:hypothetical protein
LISGRSRKMTGKALFFARKSNLCLVLFGAAVLMLGAMFLHAAYQRQAVAPLIGHVAGVVKTLELTDLCLFTEARYTRHPSQADLYSAFQDHPVSLEHFPTGSIVGPPAALRRLHGKLD